MKFNNFYIFTLMFGLCFLPIGDSLVTCINDDFEEGYSVLLKKECDPYRLKFILKNYHSDDGFLAPPETKFYLSNSLDEDKSHCLMNDSLTVTPGTRFIVNMFGYSKNTLAPTTCFLSAYDRNTNAGIGSDSKSFKDIKVLQNLTIVFYEKAEISIQLGCSIVYKDELLALGPVLIQMDSEDDCEYSGIVTPPQNSTTPLPPTTTPMPEEPVDCETITTTTTTTNTVTTVVTKTTIKSNNPESGHCPSKC